MSRTEAIHPVRKPLSHTFRQVIAAAKYEIPDTLEKPFDIEDVKALAKKYLG